MRRSTSPPELEIDVNGTWRTARFWPDGIPPSKMPYRVGSSAAVKEAERDLGTDTVVATTRISTRTSRPHKGHQAQRHERRSCGEKGIRAIRAHQEISQRKVADLLMKTMSVR